MPSINCSNPAIETNASATPLNWYEENVFKSYCFYCSLLSLKVLFLALFTGVQRFKKKVFANPEDTMVAGAKVAFDDPQIERVRRAHYNDLENILIFFTIGFLYTLTKPKPTVAINLFRVFTIARYAHTVVYAVYVVKQPARTICYGVGLAITVYMICICLRAYYVP